MPIQLINPRFERQLLNAYISKKILFFYPLLKFIPLKISSRIVEISIQITVDLSYIIFFHQPIHFYAEISRYLSIN